MLLNYLPASHVPWSVEQVRKGGDAEIYAYVHVGVCEREEGVELARRDLFSYAVVDAYARNFERAGLRRRGRRDPRAPRRRRPGRRAGRGVRPHGRRHRRDGRRRHRARHDAGLRRRRRRRAGAHAAAVGRRPPGVGRPHHPRRASGRPRTRWSCATRSSSSPAAPTASGARCAERFAAEGARGLVVVDLDGDAAEAVAERARRPAPSRIARRRGREPDVVGRRRSRPRTASGRSTCSCRTPASACGGGVDAPDEVWQRIWDVNVMAHVYAARAVLPGMLARGEGYLLHTASAAGLLTNLGDAPTASPSTPPSGWPSGWRSPTATRASRCRASARRASAPTWLRRRATGGTAGDVGAGAGLLEPEDVAEAVVAGPARRERS